MTDLALIPTRYPTSAEQGPIPYTEQPGTCGMLQQLPWNLMEAAIRSSCVQCVTMYDSPSFSSDIYSTYLLYTKLSQKQRRYNGQTKDKSCHSTLLFSQQQSALYND